MKKSIRNILFIIGVTACISVQAQIEVIERSSCGGAATGEVGLYVGRDLVASDRAIANPVECSADARADYQGSEAKAGGVGISNPKDCRGADLCGGALSGWNTTDRGVGFRLRSTGRAAVRIRITEPVVVQLNLLAATDSKDPIEPPAAYGYANTFISRMVSADPPRYELITGARAEYAGQQRSSIETQLDLCPGIYLLSSDTRSGVDTVRDEIPGERDPAVRRDLNSAAAYSLSVLAPSLKCS